MRLPVVEVAGLGLLIVGVPVLYDPLGLTGFVAIKVLAGSLGLLVLYVSLARSHALTLPGNTPSAIVGLAVLAAAAAATLSSPALERSLLGAPQRLSGLVMWLSFGAAFVLGYSLKRFRGEPVDEALWRLAVASMLTVGAMAVLEAVGVDWNAGALSFHGRLRSTLGNPSVLAALVLLLGPLCVPAANSRGPWRWPGLIGCGLGIAMLVGAQTRGAVAAAVAASAVLAAARGSRRLRLRACADRSTASRGAVGSFQLLFASLTGRWGHGPARMGRVARQSAGPLGILAAVVAFGAATVAVGRWDQIGFGLRGRIAIWEVALKTLAENALLGVGPEMFVAAYSENVSAETVREFGREGVVDRAHSGVLDFAVSFGAPATLAYVAALVGVVLIAIRSLRSPSLADVAVGSALLAYMIQQQVFFPHPALDAVFWLLAGVAAATVSSNRTREDLGGSPRRHATAHGSSVASRGTRSRSARWMPYLGLAALAIAAVSTLNSGSAMQNDHDLRRSSEAGSYEDAYAHLESAAERRPFDDEPYIAMGVLLQDTTEVALLLSAEARMREGARRNPGSELLELALAELRLQTHRVTGDDFWAQAARDGLDELARSQPTNGGAFLKRGAAAYYLGDLDAAEDDWLTATHLLPGSEAVADNLRVLEADRSQSE